MAIFPELPELIEALTILGDKAAAVYQHFETRSDKAKLTKTRHNIAVASACLNSVKELYLPHMTPADKVEMKVHTNLHVEFVTQLGNMLDDVATYSPGELFKSSRDLADVWVGPKKCCRERDYKSGGLYDAAVKARRAARGERDARRMGGMVRIMALHRFSEAGDDGREDTTNGDGPEDIPREVNLATIRELIRSAAGPHEGQGAGTRAGTQPGQSLTAPLLSPTASEVR